MKFNKYKLGVVAFIALSTAISAFGVGAAAPRSGVNSNDALKTQLEDSKLFMQNYQSEKDANKAEEKETKSQNVTEKETVKKEITEVTFIGDSVLLGAAAELTELYPDSNIDAETSRCVWDALDVIKAIEAQGELKDTVCIALGTNSPFQEETGQEIIDYLGKDRTIYWVHAYGQFLQEQDRINQTIDALGDANDNVTVIKWEDIAIEHEEYFYDDGIHLNGEGRLGYAQMIKEHI